MAPPNTGSASSKRNTVTRIDQTKSGMRVYVIPGARICMIVTMKLMPVSVELTPLKLYEALNDSYIGAAA